MTYQGTVFKSCVECESTSDYTIEKGDPATSDLQAMLYNMRSALSHCVFEGDTNPCLTTTACGPLKDALEYETLAANASTYGYCSVWNDLQVPKCSECLRVMDGGLYLNNYLQVLNGACDLLLQPPATIPLEGDIFSDTDQVNVTAPTPTSAFVSDARVGKLTYGAIAGIAIGAVVFLLVVIGCGVVLNGKRKRKAFLQNREKLHGGGSGGNNKNKNWAGAAGAGGGEMFETPVSQRPLRGGGWEDSPVSATTSTDPTYYPQYFSPYTSQYNSPVSALEGPGAANVAWPAEKTQQQQQNIGVALSPDRHNEGAGAYWGDSKGKDRAGDGGGGYELQEGINSGGGHQYPYVPPPPPHAPVLSHPGYGRFGSASPGS